MKNFEYDAIITGTSMTQNFKASEFDELFLVNSIKCAFSGAMYKEINDNLQKGLDRHDVKKVLRCLDYESMLTDKDAVNPNIEYPYYITNDNILDDVSYWFNKDIFRYTVEDVLRTLLGKGSVGFDNYANWPCGKEEVFKRYKRTDRISEMQNHLSDEERNILYENLEQNVLSPIIAHPETEFYLYFPPYSICYWDDVYRNGNLKKHEEMERYAAELLLGYDNVHLYSFNDKLDVITDLNCYRDTIHYVADINSEILKWLKNDDGLLTIENYEQYLTKTYETFRTYNYDSIFK